jgi:nucleolar GTP-binding protein
MLVLNKVDLCPYERLSPEARHAIESCAAELGTEPAQVLQMSNVSEEGVALVKNTACDALLTARVEAKLGGTSAGPSRLNDVMARLTVAMPKGAQEKEVWMPESVRRARCGLYRSVY